MQMFPTIIWQGRRVSLERPLFVTLINASSDADLRAFAHEYGGAAPPGVEELKALRDDIHLPAVVALRPLSKEQNVKLKDGPEGQTVDYWAANQLLEQTPIIGGLAERDGRDQIVFRVADLAGFLAWEVAAAVHVGATTRRCEMCSKLFLFGPSTGRRSTAQYCRDTCRVAAMRARHAEGGEA